MTRGQLPLVESRLSPCSTMSGSAVESLDLEGGLSNLSLELTKVKRIKTSKLNLLRRTLERFDADQDNLEIWKVLQVHK